MKLKNNFIFISLIVVLVFSILISITIGSVKIPIDDVYKVLLSKLFNLHLDSGISSSTIDIIWQIRFPRVILGMIVGMGLALCGLIMQALVKNPLADPYILGISSGGTLGATFSILVGTSVLGMQSIGNSVSFFAFMGALLASFAVFKISSIGGTMTSSKLVLSGVVINFICMAFSNLMIYLSNDNSSVRSLMDWSMGSLTGASLSNILLPSIAFMIVFIFFKTQSRILNVMLLGDDAAITLGVDLKKYRKLYLILISLLTGVLVSVSGLIGFVGLVIPHITRSLVGTNHKTSLKINILIGGIFLVLADILARIILTNMELPLGIITSIIGAPFFMYIMIKKAYTFSEVSDC